MSIIAGIKKIFIGDVYEKNSAEAYDLWANAYDDQPGNLMLHLDEIIFTSLFNSIDIKNRSVADIGCGTGRHWQKILSKAPARLAGFDVSQGMLNKLKQKFPGAQTVQITNDHLSAIHDNSFDIIISTLTVAHIRDIEVALNSWCRILKDNAEIVITDFHPTLLQQGGKRTFSNNGQKVSIKNYVHPVDEIKRILNKNDFRVIAEEERIIDDSVKIYYADQNALPVYNKFEGLPVIYGLHLKRSNANK
jgi:Methylase involved in ubiquinone/menaquinone biosynthesis